MTIPDLTDAPELETFAEDIYDSVLPLAWRDADVAFHLARYCGSIGAMFQPVADVARDTVDGPGWSSVVDVDRAPDEWLAWLAQFVGVTLVPGTTPAEQRERINSTDGFRRGTVAAIRSAAQLHLTGSRTVLITERLDGDAYALAVRTLDTETPDPTATAADILAAKPAGLVLDYADLTGQTYDAVHVTYDDYEDVRDTFANYEALRADIS